MELAQEELIVIAAGDDVSLPYRTERLFEAFRSTNGRAKSLSSKRIIIDSEGRATNMLEDSGPEDRFLPERIVESN